MPKKIKLDINRQQNSSLLNFVNGQKAGNTMLKSYKVLG